MDGDFERVFAGRTEAIADLGRAAHRLLLRHLPGAVVTVDDDRIGIGTDTG